MFTVRHLTVSERPKATDVQLDWFAARMRNNTFRFAKTMPRCPHHYTLRNTWSNDKDFVDCVQLIRESGYDEAFGGTRFVYLNANGYKYWTMGAPLDETTLINRAKVEKK